MARIWPILCQFGVGALLCAIGMWSGITSGYINLSDDRDKRLLYMVAAGFGGLLLLSLAFTFWLPNVLSGDQP